MNRWPSSVKRLGGDAPQIELRHAAGVAVVIFGKGVVERFANAGFDKVFAVYRQRMAEVVGKQSQIVQAEHVIGVIVGVEDTEWTMPIFSRSSCVRKSGGVSISKFPSGRPSTSAAAGRACSSDCRSCKSRNHSRCRARPPTCRFPGIPVVRGYRSFAIREAWDDEVLGRRVWGRCRRQH